MKHTHNFGPEITRKSAIWKYEIKGPGVGWGSILILNDPSFEVVECW